MKRLLVVLFALFVAVPAPQAAAQLSKDGPIVYGHHHLNTNNPEAFKKFWADTLGGTLIKIGTNNLEIIKFPGALLFWRPAQAPTGGSIGTSVNHLGFSVPNLRQTVDKLKANGYRMITTQEAPAGVAVKDDIGVTGNGIAYVLGPDDVKVELLQVNGQAAPIVYHHVHFFGPQAEDMRAWYMKVFGATERKNAALPSGIVGADLPGSGLNFSQSAIPVVGTRGRVIDHIGFEVKNLADFCKKLEAQGIPLTTSYRNNAAIDTAIAFVTDPWGTSIELSEGLAKF